MGKDSFLETRQVSKVEFAVHYKGKEILSD